MQSIFGMQAAEIPELSKTFFIDLISLVFVTIISKLADTYSAEKNKYFSLRGWSFNALIITLSIIPPTFSLATFTEEHVKENPILCLTNIVITDKITNTYNYRIILIVVLLVSMCLCTFIARRISRHDGNNSESRYFKRLAIFSSVYVLFLITFSMVLTHVDTNRTQCTAINGLDGIQAVAFYFAFILIALIISLWLFIGIANQIIIIYSGYNSANKIIFIILNIIFVTLIVSFYVVFHDFVKQIPFKTSLGFYKIINILLRSINYLFDIILRIIDFSYQACMYAANGILGVIYFIAEHISLTLYFLISYWYILIIALLLASIVIYLRYSKEKIKAYLSQLAKKIRRKVKFKMSSKAIILFIKSKPHLSGLTLVIVSFIALILWLKNKNIVDEIEPLNPAVPTVSPSPIPTPVAIPQLTEFHLLCSAPYRKPVWGFGKEDAVEFAITDCEPIDKSEFCEADTLVALGVSSADGPALAEVERSQNRGENLAKQLKSEHLVKCRHKSDAPAIYVLNLGQPKNTYFDSEFDRKVQVFLGKDIIDQLTLDRLLRKEIDQQLYNVWDLNRLK